MLYWEILLVCLGLSLDVYAVSVCQGALLGCIKKGRLAVMGIIFCVMQVTALELGQHLSALPSLWKLYDATLTAWHVLSALIYFALAVYLLIKAIRHQPIFERRSEIRYRRIFSLAALTSIDALLVGFSSGLLDAYWLSSGITLFVITALCVIAGVFTGYHFGYEPKNKAYWGGGALFVAAGVIILLRHLT
jgi:putative Mn2+ efflux pump MntP